MIKMTKNRTQDNVTVPGRNRKRDQRERRVIWKICLSETGSGTSGGCGGALELSREFEVGAAGGNKNLLTHEKV